MSGGGGLSEGYLKFALANGEELGKLQFCGVLRFSLSGDMGVIAVRSIQGVQATT
jgi:hypothetical protein